MNLVLFKIKLRKRGHRPLVESMDGVAPEDVARREILANKISDEVLDSCLGASR